MTQQFRVVISGRTISGGPLADIKAEVGRAFRLQGEQLERMLSGGPMVVSRSCTMAAAEKLHGRLQALDLEARIEALTPAAAPVSPPPPPVKAAPALAAGSDELFALGGPEAAVPAAAASPAAAPVMAVPVAGGAVAGQGDAIPALEPLPAADVVCPKCGETQPKRTLCRKCGLDMPRYLAAQEAAEREAREERAAALEARRQAPGAASGGDGERQAGVLGISFSGRLGRLDYFAGSLLSTTLWLLFVLLAVATGKAAFAGLGLFLSAVYSLRCIVLRLHDTGRTGWLGLIVLVPVLGALMALVLLFIGGNDDENEYGGLPADGGGRRAILVLVAFFVVGGMSYRSVSQSPDKAMRFLQAVSSGQGKAVADDEHEPAGGQQAAVRYSSNNRIDMYVMAGCGACDQMRAWLAANGLHTTVYAVDSDPYAAQRLRSLVAGDGQGRITLPVLEINGKVLPGNPGIDNVHRYLQRD